MTLNIMSSSSSSGDETAIEVNPDECKKSAMNVHPTGTHLNLGAMINGDSQNLRPSVPVIPTGQMPIRGTVPLVNQQSTSSIVHPHLSFASKAKAGQVCQQQSANQQKMDALFRSMEEQDKHSVRIVCPYKDGVVYSHDQVLQAIESVGINRKAIQAYGQMEKN